VAVIFRPEQTSEDLAPFPWTRLDRGRLSRLRCSRGAAAGEPDPVRDRGPGPDRGGLQQRRDRRAPRRQPGDDQIAHQPPVAKAGLRDRAQAPITRTKGQNADVALAFEGRRGDVEVRQSARIPVQSWAAQAVQVRQCAAAVHAADDVRHALATPGRPLDPPTREQMERRFLETSASYGSTATTWPLDRLAGSGRPRTWSVRRSSSVLGIAVRRRRANSGCSRTSSPMSSSREGLAPDRAASGRSVASTRRRPAARHGTCGAARRRAGQDDPAQPAVGSGARGGRTVADADQRAGGIEWQRRPGQPRMGRAEGQRVTGAAQHYRAVRCRPDRAPGAGDRGRARLRGAGH
jgi:hypothetical protein